MPASRGDVRELFASTPGMDGGLFYMPIQYASLITPQFLNDPRAPLPGVEGTSRFFLGYLKEDGVDEGEDRTTKKEKSWGGDKIFVGQSEYDATWEFSLVQYLNPTVQQIAHGASNVTIIPGDATRGQRVAILHNGDVLDMGIYIARSKYGQARKQIVAMYAQPTKIDKVKSKHDELSAFKVTLDLLNDLQGNAYYEVLDNGVLVPGPSQYLVTLPAGQTGGNWTLTVSGETTAPIAFDAANAAVKSALEALDSTGTVTVTGASAGVYNITLPNGGTLTANGSGLVPNGAPGAISVAKP